MPTTTIDLSRFSATCRAELTGQDIVVSLTVANDTGGLLRGVMTEPPLVQLEAGAALSLDRVPQPRSYSVLATGKTVQFTWHGRLTAAGAAGISVVAVASGGNGEYLRTALVDCGTVSSAQLPSPTPRPTATPTAVPPPATPCVSCGPSVRDFIADKWASSAHASTDGPAQDNTFCARCHSPLQADAAATAESNRSIGAADWQAVTCSVCHPPAAQRSEWGTPIGTYDIATRSYRPVPVGDADVVCTQCHTGDFAPGFQNYGRIMHEAAVRCIDCHMASIPASTVLGDLPAHDFKATANLPYSCGTYPGGCHSRRPESWAVRILELSPIHAPKM